MDLRFAAHSRSIGIPAHDDATAAVRIAVALVALVFAGRASAQRTAILSWRVPMQSCNRDSIGTGTIVGRLVADSTALRVNRGVMTPGCITLADSSGRFVFRGLLPGEHMIALGELGGLITSVAKISVTAGRTDTLVIPVRMDGRAGDCIDVLTCAPLLDPTLPLLTGDDALREVAYRTAIAITANHRESLTARAYCLRGILTETDPVLVALKRRIETVRPESACERFDTTGTSQNIRDRATGRLAWFISVRNPRVSGDHAAMGVGYSAAIGRPFGASWDCGFIRVGGSWRPVHCKGVGAA